MTELERYIAILEAALLDQELRRLYAIDSIDAGDSASARLALQGAGFSTLPRLTR